MRFDITIEKKNGETITHSGVFRHTTAMQRFLDGKNFFITHDGNQYAYRANEIMNFNIEENDNEKLNK